MIHHSDSNLNHMFLYSELLIELENRCASRAVIWIQYIIRTSRLKINWQSFNYFSVIVVYW